MRAPSVIPQCQFHTPGKKEALPKIQSLASAHKCDITSKQVALREVRKTRYREEGEGRIRVSEVKPVALGPTTISGLSAR